MSAGGFGKSSAWVRQLTLVAICGAAISLTPPRAALPAEVEDSTPPPAEAPTEEHVAASRELVQRELAALSEGKGDWKRLTITYDDRHGLHGGLKLAIRGDGRVEQEAVRTKAGKPVKAVSRAELEKLVDRLIELKAWEQKTAERAARPDESRAKLEIRVGDTSVTIWEWFNDVSKNDRIGAVRGQMQRIAWEGGQAK